jgi:hypothetical protein
MGTRPESTPRPPTLLDAILPVIVLITLIVLTIVLFGVSATDGPPIFSSSVPDTDSTESRICSAVRRRRLARQ